MKFVTLHVHEIELVFHPVLLCSIFSLDESLRFSHVGWNYDMCSLEWSESNIIENLYLNNFSNSVLQTVVLALVYTDYFRLLLQIHRRISGKNQSHFLLQMFYIIPIQRSKINWQNQVHIHLRHQFLEIHLDNVLELSPQVHWYVVNLATFLFHLIIDQNLVGKVDNRRDLTFVWFLDKVVSILAFHFFFDEFQYLLITSSGPCFKCFKFMYFQVIKFNLQLQYSTKNKISHCITADRNFSDPWNSNSLKRTNTTKNTSTKILKENTSPPTIF